MRKPGLINGATIIGLLLGPAIGAFLYASIGGLLTMSGEFFGFYLAWTIVPGYLIGLPIFAVTLLAMRHWRIDPVWLCGVIGLIAGLIGYYVLLGDAIAPGELQAVVIHAALPSAVMFVAARLIAGART